MNSAGRLVSTTRSKGKELMRSMIYMYKRFVKGHNKAGRWVAGSVYCVGIVVCLLLFSGADREVTSTDVAMLTDPIPVDGFEPYTESIGESLVTFDMIPVEGGTVVLQTPDGEQRVEVPSIWISETEVTWDAYDIFAYSLDIPEAERIQYADAESRPSRPYEAPDYGFGHQGYAAMSVTFHAATEYAKWLSEKTGHTYRLATEAEWQHAALAGLEADAELTEDALQELAWFKANAESKTHPVASKEPNALGIYDMLGNVQEWVIGYDGKPVTRGGSYRDDVAEVQYNTRETQSRRWNERDPQIPKSRWWLSDGPFVGFRIVRALD